jgi:alpha-mannosidase
MALTVEWRGRIDRWRETIRQHLLYTELGPLALRGFTTLEQLTPGEALRRPHRPMPVGTPWGAKWAYAWLRGTLTLPAAATGARIVLRGSPGGHARVLVNGREVGALDNQHGEILLAEKGRPGARYDILMEVYAGHGPMNCGGGPNPDGVESVPEPPATQTRVERLTFGIWHEEAFQLWMDVQTLLEVRDVSDPNSLRVAEIDAGLRDFTLIADLELPRETLTPTLVAARARLKPLLEARNGSTAPMLYCFGHAHIDVAWLWPLAETERKAARTFSSQLTLMEQYPEYRFLQSQPHLYQMVKERYPALYTRIREAVRRGQWVPEGGMWIEADTNITGGESLIRQFLHGMRFFEEEFGVTCRLMWLPDVFGYSGALPQIMKGCEIDYFSTQKIFWNYEGGELFPYNTFWWEGIDGTRILSHFHNDYNSPTNPQHTVARWRDRVQKDGICARLMPFGWGDGGGGPTREHLEYLRRQRNLEGVPRTVQASPLAFFKQEEARRADLPVFVGELYLQVHRGTYTSQARTKLGNRRCEFSLRDTELWSIAAAALAGRSVARPALDRLWKMVLLNQFHDILPGSSIARVYQEAEADYDRVLSESAALADRATGALVRRKSGAITVFNALSWPRHAVVELPAGFEGIEDADGRALPVQRVGARRLVRVENVPACGWATYKRAKALPATAPVVEATTRRIENAHLRLTLAADGSITSILDKESGRELAAGPCNDVRMYRDVPVNWDAWDLNSSYRKCPVALTGKAEVDVIATGAVLGAVRIRRRIGRSTWQQEIRLAADSRRVDFVTTVDWRESHKLLKVSFPTAIRDSEALHEVQFGHLRRPTHASRQFDADRFEVCNQKWTALTESAAGVALLNDCKYGIDVSGHTLSLTLLKSALAPDMTADKGKQTFTYAFYAWNGSFADCGLVREAYDLNAPVTVRAGDGGTRSLFEVSAANVIIEAVKPAEDGSGDVIVRLYESKRMSTDCVLKTSLAVRRATLVNMRETRGTRVPLRAGTMALTFRPFEIKTVRLTA